jgi:hypothetical protein
MQRQIEDLRRKSEQGSPQLQGEAMEVELHQLLSMQDDLRAERKAIQKQWAKRETQLEWLMISTVGMYGDLQGIAGRSLEEIEALNLLSLAPPRGEASADRQPG